MEARYLHAEMRLLLFFLSSWLQNKSRVPFYESQGKYLEQKVFEGLLLLHSKESFWIAYMKYLIVLTANLF